MKERIFISLGSNLGQRGVYLRGALCRLAEEVNVVRVSPPLRTRAWGYTSQPDFINMAAEITTDLSPRALLELLLRLETEAGRVRSEKWGPRVLDLDILYYGQRIVDEPGLILPHPHIAGRRFVLQPLSAIAPDWVDPRSGLTILSLLNRLMEAES